MRRSGKQGFSIVEMLMVIGVLAVLMAIVTTASTAAIRTARGRRTEALKAVLQAGIATYNAQYGRWPGGKSGALEKFATDGIESETTGGVRSGTQVAFLSATEYDNMVSDLVRVSVNNKGAPVMDVTGMHVAAKAVASTPKAHGTEFKEATKKNKKRGMTLKLADMSFGYQTKENGYFRRFIVQYNSVSDSVLVMTEEDFVGWCKDNFLPIQYPTGYKQAGKE